MATVLEYIGWLFAADGGFIGRAAVIMLALVAVIVAIRLAIMLVSTFRQKDGNSLS